MAVWFLSITDTRNGRTFDGYVNAADEEAAKILRRAESGKLNNRWQILLYRRDGTDVILLVESGTGTG